jgi:hypothetical protein
MWECSLGRGCDVRQGAGAALPIAYRTSTTARNPAGCCGGGVVDHRSTRSRIPRDEHAPGVLARYGRLGPTEARIGLIAVNTLLALGLVPSFTVAGLGLGVVDIFGLGLVALMLGGLAVRVARNLRELALLEPAGQAAP